MGKQDQNEPKKPVSAAQAAAGAVNLAEWRAGHPRGGAPAVTHGIRSTIDHGAVPVSLEGGAEVTERVNALIEQMVLDLGGRAELTAQQEAILATQRVALLVVLLAERYLCAQGILTRAGRPHALLSKLGSYANLIRHNAVVLGLERRARKVGPASLAEYLEMPSETTAAAEAPAKETNDDA